MTEAKSKTRPNPVWSLLSSVRLTVVLLIVLAVVSILGTLIPQGGQGAFEFAKGLNPRVFKFFTLLELFDLYHSLWFRLLLGCLTLNIIICSMDRFPRTWRRFSAVLKPDRKRPFEGIPPLQTFQSECSQGEASRLAGAFLKAHYKRTREKESDGTLFLHGEKGRYSHFGVYLVHLSVLIILVGGLIGSLFGFEAYINIPEGEVVDYVTLRKNRERLGLGFQIRCDKFFVDFYENGTPKEYRADLTFLVKEKKAEKKSILVNHPVQFKGVTFYQASYGTIPGNRVHLKISRPASRNRVTDLTVETGNFVPLPGGEGQFQVAETRGDFMRMGPAVLIEIRPKQGENVHFWLFQELETIKKRFPGIADKFPKLNPSSFAPYLFSLDKLESRYYTGLQANRDPGVEVVWTGCFLMVIGFFITFFTSHRRIWVRLAAENRHTMVSVAGTASKNPVGLQRELEKLTNDLRKALDKKA